MWIATEWMFPVFAIHLTWRQLVVDVKAVFDILVGPRAIVICMTMIAVDRCVVVLFHLVFCYCLVGSAEIAVDLCGSTKGFHTFQHHPTVGTICPYLARRPQHSPFSVCSWNGVSLSHTQATTRTTTDPADCVGKVSLREASLVSEQEPGRLRSLIARERYHAT
jgi:hypothetical protein